MLARIAPLPLLIFLLGVPVRAQVVHESQVIGPFDGVFQTGFGASCDVDGDWLAVGARPLGNGVYLYRHTAQGWSYVDKLVEASAPSVSYFAFGLDLSGSHLLVSAPT